MGLFSRISKHADTQQNEATTHSEKNEIQLKGKRFCLKGYFDYDRDGFGPVALSAKQLTDEIVSSIDTQFAPSSEYQKRIDGFFPLKDKHNCDRIFEVIQTRSKEKHS